ncbi:hypothetical protein R3P38DRAFT_2805745 [Favolaschia claudopus]|uniref:Uncharacterized protein n=1 Tax=Favolaschia claudopus TaxID=2862362 RepID=A0AAV9ZMF2_9AGAR
MPPIRGSRCTPPPEARGNINDFLPDAYITINVSFYLSIWKEDLTLDNGATDAHYHCDSLNHASNPQELVVQRQATRDVLLLILRRLSEYIEGDKEKALFVMYCTLFVILFPGSLKLTDRLRLVPLIALPFLVIPSILSLNDTITLVDVMGERRPILLAVWKDQEVKMSRQINNEEISAIIETNRYRIQDARYSVYQPGSHMVSAGATLFMAAVLSPGPMITLRCPWCYTRMPVFPGWNLQAFIDCTGCKRRFSTSHSESSALWDIFWSKAVSDNTLGACAEIFFQTNSNTSTAKKKTDDLKQLRTVFISNISFKFIHLLLRPSSPEIHKPPPRTKPTPQGRWFKTADTTQEKLWPLSTTLHLIGGISNTHPQSSPRISAHAHTESYPRSCCPTPTPAQHDLSDKKSKESQGRGENSSSCGLQRRKTLLAEDCWRGDRKTLGECEKAIEDSKEYRASSGEANERMTHTVGEMNLFCTIECAHPAIPEDIVSLRSGVASTKPSKSGAYEELRRER